MIGIPSSIDINMDNFDENRYVKDNLDIAAALKSGAIQSARLHFEQNGIYENRKYLNENAILDAKKKKK